MKLDAVGALRRQANGYRHQMVVEDNNGSVFERLFVKSPKGFHRFRCILIELLQPSEIFHIKHVGDSILVLGKALPTMRGMGSAFGYTSRGFNSDSPKRTGMAKFDPPKSRTIAKLIPMT